jgi:acyl carrier protein
MIQEQDPIFTKVQEIVIHQLGVVASEVIPDARLDIDLGADELDTVELVMQFEEVFSINISDEDVEKFTKVGDVVAYLKSKGITG